MNQLLILLLLISTLSLVGILFKVLNNIDQATALLKKSQPDSSELSFLLTGKLYIYSLAVILCFTVMGYWYTQQNAKEKIINRHRLQLIAEFDTAKIWNAPDFKSMLDEKNYPEIQYGFDLISHTSDYLGPQGTIKNISNGMNCQNCHLSGASLPFGNNYSAVAATYPKFRARSGTAETICKRVNDCFQRSLNGQALDSTSKEMNAIKAYITWLGSNVPKGKVPKGSGLLKLKFLNRAANTDSGKIVFVSKCQSCHGTDGQGLPMPEGNGRKYPPLWGEHSFNEAAGLFRLSSMAGYVKANMPFGTNYQSPQLSDTEAWDVAAFITVQPRPKHLFLKTDWPKIETKPFDHPFGPYKDSFPEIQHKFGPFQPIVDAQKKVSNVNNQVSVNKK